MFVAAKGDVLVVAGLPKAFHPSALRLPQDEQLPALSEARPVAFNGSASNCIEEAKTEPPARYSQGKLIQERDGEAKPGANGEVHVRHAIIERPYAVSTA